MASEPEPEDYRPFPNVSRRNWTQELLEVPAMVRFIGLPSGLKILEVGCGRGVALVPLAKLCAPTLLTGIDIDATALKEASSHLSERGIRADLMQADMRHMPFANGTYDIIIDFGTCYHISSAGGALQEITRVLAIGGLFVYETLANQLMSHPIRSFGKTLPWEGIGALRPYKTRFLWSSRVKVRVPR